MPLGNGSLGAAVCAANGFSAQLKEPYIEAIGVLTAAINEAMATGFDGTIRLAPALAAGTGRNLSRRVGFELVE